MHFGAAARVDVKPDDAVCVEYENGVRLWMRRRPAARAWPLAATRGNETPAWEIDSAARVSSVRDELAGGADRGPVGPASRRWNSFGIDVAAKSARLIGDKVRAQPAQAARKAAPGLFRVSLGAEPALARIADGAGPKTPPAAKPVLVFLHGTMSSLAGSFGALVVHRQ